jgi:hypothetical protein
MNNTIKCACGYRFPDSLGVYGCPNCEGDAMTESDSRTTYTLSEAGTVLTETQEGITMPADYSFATVNDYVHGIDVHFEDLVALCLGMASHIDGLTRERDPSALERRLFRQHTEKRPTFCEGLPDAHLVWLRAGVQRFCLSTTNETAAEAEWMRTMLAKALAAIVLGAIPQADQDPHESLE